MSSNFIKVMNPEGTVGSFVRIDSIQCFSFTNDYAVIKFVEGNELEIDMDSAMALGVKLSNN